jgi:predicted secreted protein
MRRLLIACLLLLPLAAGAQDRPALRLVQPDPTRATMQLAETAEITVRQDELHALLAVEVRGASAAAVQAAVNRTMTAALERARGTAAVTVATGGYSVWRAYGSGVPSSQAWQGSQTLQLTANDPAPLLELVGTLQGQGLAVRQLAFRVSRELFRQTREQATEEALRNLSARAERMAGVLGLVFERFAHVELGADRDHATAMQAFAAPSSRGVSDSAPPVAEAAEVRIGATVTAEAILKPR